MGVYGSFERHDGGNPGTFTVLMNEDIPGLTAEIGINVNGAGWRMVPMRRTGFIDHNSIWMVQPDEPFPAGAVVDYFFHGFDEEGRHIWDSRNGENYRLQIPEPIAVRWLGNVRQWPPADSLTARDNLWINAESWPAGAADRVAVVLTTNRWENMRVIPMSRAGREGQNDWWHVNLGSFFGGTRIEYAVFAMDPFDAMLWAHDDGGNFVTDVAPGRSVLWAGNQSQWPPHGQLTPYDDFWLNGESWPREAAMAAFARYTVNGGIWFHDPLQYGGVIGQNDWWHQNMGRVPPGAMIHYVVEVLDENGKTTIAAEGMRETFSAGTNQDTDGDRLPDDWERFWWENLDETGEGNPDHDGTDRIPLDNRLERLLGTEPGFSNRLDTIPLIWSPAEPARGAPLHLSYEPRVHGILSGSDIVVRVHAGAEGGTLVEPLVEDPETGRFENQLTAGLLDDRMIVSFEDGVSADDNFGIFWSIPVDLAASPSGTLFVSAYPAPGVYTSIQQAVRACAEGSVIQLGEGTHFLDGPVDFAGKKCTVRGGEDVRIIPAESAPAFVFSGGESRETVLENVEITGAGTAQDGAAIICRDASPTLRNVTVTDCYTLGRGGALRVVGGAPLLDRVTIRNCTAYRGGGAVSVTGSTGMIIRASSLSGNRALGLYASGGAVECETSRVTISFTFMHDNAAGDRGGAVSSAGGSDVSVIRCTLTANRASENDGSCFASDASDVRVVDSILWNNADPEFAGVGITAGNSIVQFHNAGPGNFNIDPHLVAGTFRLQAHSPCIDAGTSTAGNNADPDGEGEQGAPDVGCDEFVDQDRDGMADAWERLVGGGLSLPPGTDPDGDVLSSLDEYRLGLLPLSEDTDGDGLPDGWETVHHLDPRYPGDALDELDVPGLPALYQYHHRDKIGFPASGETTLESLAAAAEASGSLQDRIDAAAPFGIILLASGIYRGLGNRQLVLEGKNLMIAAAETDGPVVIDCEGQGRGITFGPGVDNRTLLRGITVINGHARSNDGEGGGIRCAGGSPVIESCIVQSNRSEIGGGGICLEDSDAVVRNCDISFNTASYNWGGGMLIRGGFPVIEACRIIGNRGVATAHYGGGGLFTAGGDTTIRNTIVAGNRAERNGGGMYIGFGSSVDLINCTVVDNIGQGIFETGDLDILNCIIWSNESDLVRSVPYSARPLMNSVCGGVDDPEYGTFSRDPRLRSGTFSLTAESPCIDAGLDIGAPLQDIDGELRWDHPDVPNTASWVDIGADEFVDLDLDGLDNMFEYRIGTNPINTDTDHDGLSDRAEVEQFGSSPVSADTDGDSYTDGEERADGMDPLNAQDGLAMLESSRRLISSHWYTFYGTFPAFRHEPGSPGDLAELDARVKQLSDLMVRSVYP